MFNLADKVLKIASRDADYAEVRAEHISSSNLVMKNGSIESAEFSIGNGLAIRAVIDGALGVAFVNSKEMAEIEKAVNNAIKLAEKASHGLKTKASFAPEKPNRAKYEVKQKRKVENISLDEKIYLLKELEKSIVSQKINVPMRFFSLNDELRHKLIVNSEGSKIESLIPKVNLFYMLTAEKNGDTEQRMNQFGSSAGYEMWDSWKIREAVPQEAKMLTTILAKAKAPPKEKIDIVLSPELMGIASHESCGHPYEADRIWGREGAQAGESFLEKDSIGKRIGSDAVTLVDDPTVENSYGFYLYDDDCVKARRRFLIKNGIINEFLQNRWTGAIWRVPSNGSARAGTWNREPIIRMANTFVLPGDHSVDELFQDVKKGVYIKSYMEWNIDDKRFNQKYTGLEAYRIENGELKELVRRPRLEVTTPTFWSSVDACAKDLEFSTGNCGKNDPQDSCPVWFGGPHARLRGIRLG